MKKFCLLMVVIVSSMLSFAQDIIITCDAKRIESKIQEVSLTEVRYQTWDNLDGPVFVLPTSEISVITFQNGTIQVFDNAKSSTNNNQSINSSELISGTISRFGNMYSLRQNGRETQMDRDAYLYFVNQHCPAAYNEYIKGNNMRMAGWGMLGAGLPVCLAVGVPMLLCCWTYGGVVTGAVFIAVGGAATLASVPLLCVGYSKCNNSHNIYNIKSSQHTQTLSLNGQISQDGIGLALRF